MTYRNDDLAMKTLIKIKNKKLTFKQLTQKEFEAIKNFPPFIKFYNKIVEEGKIVQ